jgi:ammonium transporter, Amt family
METTLTLTVNNLWMMICTALVFFMHLGFSFLEIGLTRQKNTVNILFKNFFIISAGLVLYATVGFNLMYPTSFWHGVLPDYFVALFGLESPVGAEGLDLSYNQGYTYWTDFLFQGMFAATAATIVSGAVAERAKLGSFFLFSVLYVGIVYPIVGSWKWGGGFLDEWGFYDFAGSTLVHSVGGWAAVLYIAKLGPRIGKFGEDGKPRPIPGHNLPFAAAGVLILWLGWFGFNGGSVLSADPAITSLVITTTSIAAAAGGLAAATFVHFRYKNFDLTMFMNGILGGLVSITASADQVSIMDAMMIGSIGGIVVVLAVSLLDTLRLDDPVGAVAVHLFTGIWGTSAVGIFGALASWDQFLIQLAGIGLVALFCLATTATMLTVIEKIWGLRVSRGEELEGLDQAEHGGMNAYADFRMNQH